MTRGDTVTQVNQGDSLELVPRPFPLSSFRLISLIPLFPLISLPLNIADTLAHYTHSLSLTLTLSLSLSHYQRTEMRKLPIRGRSLGRCRRRLVQCGKRPVRGAERIEVGAVGALLRNGRRG